MFQHIFSVVLRVPFNFENKKQDPYHVKYMIYSEKITCILFCLRAPTANMYQTSDKKWRMIGVEKTRINETSQR